MLASRLRVRAWAHGAGWALAALVASVALGGETAAPTKPAAAYLGFKTCGLCHREVGAAWPATRHGKALSDESLPQGLQGCEACHGPGSLHVGATGKQKITDLPVLSSKQIEALCAKCHSSSRGADVPAVWPVLDAESWAGSAHYRQSRSCLACHKAHAESSHALSAPAEELCFSCHASVRNPDANGYTHSPVAKAQCDACHTPHGGQAPHNLVANLGKVCETCHDPSAAAMTSAHSGYQTAGANCVRCHDPHSFDKQRALLRKVEHPPFQRRSCNLCHAPAPSTALVKPMPDACLGCHSKDKLLPEKDTNGAPMRLHAPASAGLCTKCHEPHVADNPASLVDTASAVCFGCHQKVRAAAGASHPHDPVAKGNCLSCHKGHASTAKGLLLKDQRELCESCHQNQAQHAHPIGDKAKDPNTGEPLACASCHAVHGSEFTAILPMEETAMCLTCHHTEHLSG